MGVYAYMCDSSDQIINEVIVVLSIILYQNYYLSNPPLSCSGLRVDDLGLDGGCQGAGGGRRVRLIHCHRDGVYVCVCFSFPWQ